MVTRLLPWFYLSHGCVIGPLSIEALVESWLRHDIGDQSLIWSPGMTEWRPYSEFTKLLMSAGRLPKGVAPEHVQPPPPPHFQDPELIWLQAPNPPAAHEPSVLLARAALVRKSSASWPEALRAIRYALFLPSSRSGCHLWIAPGLLAAVTLGLKRSIGLLSYPLIGTIGIPTGKEEGGLLFQIITSQGVRFAIVDTGTPSLALLAVETNDSYIGVTSLDYRAFTQPSENRKLIRTAARAYDALGLQPEVERSLLLFTEKLYNRSFATWAGRVFGGALR